MLVQGECVAKSNYILLTFYPPSFEHKSGNVVVVVVAAVLRGEVKVERERVFVW